MQIQVCTTHHPATEEQHAVVQHKTSGVCRAILLCFWQNASDDSKKTIHVLARHWLANEIPNLVWRFYKFQIVSHVVLRLKRTTFEMGLSSSFQSPCTPTSIKRLLHMHTHSIPDYMFVPVEDESIHFLHANSRVLILLPLPSHLKQHSP